MEIPAHVQQELDRLVEEYRSRCLWSLRPDFLPRTLGEAREALRQIESHGDLEAFRRVARIKPWLSPPSSATSAGS
jgi:hypothetical protein